MLKEFKKIKLIFIMMAMLILNGCSSGGDEKKVESKVENNVESKAEDSKEDDSSGEEDISDEEDEEDEYAFAKREAILIEDRLIEDREGIMVLMPDTTERIISMAPSITETLVNLGLGDNIVGVDFYSLGIEGISQDLPAFDLMTPNIEEMIELEADILFGSGMSNVEGSNPFVQLVGAGAFITSIPTPTSIDGMIEDILFIGAITETSDKAEEIVEKFESELKEIEDLVDEYLKENPRDEDLKVYFETSPAPYMYSFGNDVFLNEYLEILELENIFSDEDGWLAVSDEQVLERNPDIIFTNATYEENPDEDIKNRDGWDSIKAVENGQVYVIDGDRSARPNELSIEALESMYEHIYE